VTFTCPAVRGAGLCVLRSSCQVGRRLRHVLRPTACGHPRHISKHPPAVAAPAGARAAAAAPGRGGVRAQGPGRGVLGQGLAADGQQGGRAQRGERQGRVAALRRLAVRCCYSTRSHTACAQRAPPLAAARRVRVHGPLPGPRRRALPGLRRDARGAVDVRLPATGPSA